MMNLEEIARLAGVSQATVSRVINNKPYVSEEVRQRVLLVIDREGFQPNAAARALVRQRTEVLGVVAPEGLGPIFAQPYFSTLLEGISTTITQSEYVMALWAGSTPEETARIYERILGYRLMDGALLLSAIDDDPLPRELADRKMPIVMIGHSFLAEVSTVDSDNMGGGRAATEHLIRLGHRRIAHITGRLDIVSSRERIQGYQMALQSNRLEFDPALVIEGNFNEKSGYYAARKVVALGVDAVFVGNDNMAVGLIRGLTELGVSIPSDIAIIGFDNVPTLNTMKPALSTVQQPVREMGKIAAQMLIDLIDGRVTPPHRIVLPTELIIRESCGMLKA